ncbi:hypothetical protein IR117_03500 [Streptococcus danieliae]|nr:hypothetical protein [Streptococcus danieliae]
MSWHQRVRQGYLQLLDENPDRLVKVDASLDLPEVLDQALQRIVERLSL